MSVRPLPSLIVALGLAWSAVAAAGEWSGYVSGEARLFTRGPIDPAQGGDGLSFSAQPEYYTEWDGGRQSFTFVPFVRWDGRDSERTHADIRELTWLEAADTWELRLGVRKVFWGVTESQHLVDIVNQTDLVEATDGEEKLGQPMINLALIGERGTLDLFVLPGFRERTFPGRRGRLRSRPRIAPEQVRYESRRRDRHVDYAARWSAYIGDWDYGLSYFAGTSRDPRFESGRDADGAPVLVPVYDLIRQWGIDVQATLGDWLWKLEVIGRHGQGPGYTALTGGFEYTFVGIADSSADLGIIAEALYDDRGRSAPTPFADDVMFGARLTLNDEQSTECLLGLIVDRRGSEKLVRLESSRRMGDAWKIGLEGQAFVEIDRAGPLAGLARDDYLQLEIARYF